MSLRVMGNAGGRIVMLLYKAWRESRHGFLLSLGVLALFCTVFSLSPRTDLPRLTYAAIMWGATYGGALCNIFLVLSLLLGLGGFLRERLYGTLAYTLSLPVRRSRFVVARRSEEHTSELQSRLHLVCRLLLEKKKAHNARGSTSKTA